VSKTTHLGLIGNGWLVGELHFGGLQDRVLLEDRGLRLVVTEGLLAIQTLVEDHAHTPHVHFGGDLRRILAYHKALGWQIPIGVDKKNNHLVLKT